MKLKLGEQEIELRMTSLAVERIEEEFDMSINDFFGEGVKMKAKTVNFMLWAMANTELELPEFKKEVAKHHTYDECIMMLTDTFKTPNDESPAIEQPC